MDLYSGPFYDALLGDERTQLEAVLDTHRAMLLASLEGITEAEARARLVPSKTTLLGLVKHATYVEQIWFTEAVTGTPRAELGLPPTVHDSFDLADDDTVAGVAERYRTVVAGSRARAAGLSLDDVVTGHRLGPMTLRWVYLHLVRETAQHCGHADILREQLLAARAVSQDQEQTR